MFEGKRYRISYDAPIAPCPPHIAARLSRADNAPAATTAPAELCEADTAAALADGWALVARTKPAAEGERNNSAHALAGRLKRLAVSEDTCREMVLHWNASNLPPSPEDELAKTVASSYANGDWPLGADRPEAEFEDISADPALPQPKPTTTPSAIITATPYVWADPCGIPPRDWILGRHLVRKFVSATIAPGGVGKSSLVIVEALSIVTGRVLLGGRAPRPGRVWLWNGEDPYDELQRRIQAVCLHYGITREAIEGRFFVDSGRQRPIVIATETKQGAKIAEPVVEQVKATIRENKIDVFTVDPFVSCHRVSENDNGKIEAVAWEWAKIADACDCAIDLVHHSRKTGGMEVTAEHARGASALLGKARAVRVLNVMSGEEAKKAGIEQPRLYFRVDNGKANMAPPSDAADWYQLQGVPLGNATGDRPQDEIGVVLPWVWRDAEPDDGLPEGALLKAQQALVGGEWRADQRAEKWAGRPIMKALGLTGHLTMESLLYKWTEAGAFVEYDGKDAQRRPRKFLRPVFAPVT